VKRTSPLPPTTDDAKGKEKPFRKKQETAAAAAAVVHYHLVFSTGCTVYQDWQSHAFFYHVHKVGQHVMTLQQLMLLVRSTSRDNSRGISRRTLSPNFTFISLWIIRIAVSNQASPTAILTSLWE
jgi:hypothetical protein